ncbi:hypothetical protein H4R20_001919 [Coemansia guatemalensis]|uniref:Uncharacterized protein n=1 Tax=Coemansia guatemalensis TaxID=2761395 RepID=A0A9W8LU38_9FUNG|nr:hypothetical protein H4R20_001919 [Coemansia guatemalensis]
MVVKSSNALPGEPLPLDEHFEDFSTDDNDAKVMRFLNIEDNELVHQRFLIVYGKVPGIKGRGSIVVHHPDFPSLTFPAVDGYFKALAQLDTGKNCLKFEYILEDKCICEGLLTVENVSDQDKPPLHLAIVVASDSPKVFDAPPETSGPGMNDLDAAISKLRCAAYLWQAFTAEQMRRHGFGRMTFCLQEVHEQDTMARDGKERMVPQVHVVKSKLTLAEIQDKKYAQQWSAPPGAEHCGGGQLSIARDALKESGLFNDDHCVACLTMDSHWDPEQKVLLGHGAVASTYPTPRTGVFGSHTTHAWPACAEEIADKFMDTTKTDARYLANDAGESGEYWQAANIGMAAFLHMASVPMSVTRAPSGLTARGYKHFNRAFMACEPGKEGPILQRDEGGAYLHRLNAIRLRYNPCIAPSAERKAQDSNAASVFDISTDNGIVLECSQGVTLICIQLNGKYRTHLEYTAENLERRQSGIIAAEQDELIAEFPTRVVLSKNRLRELVGQWTSTDNLSIIVDTHAANRKVFSDIQKSVKYAD